MIGSKQTNQISAGLDRQQQLDSSALAMPHLLVATPDALQFLTKLLRKSRKQRKKKVVR